ncbi:protein-disulfide reductase DsbD domain-containing protein [Halovulum sp. GXIMD14794]
MPKPHIRAALLLSTVLASAAPGLAVAQMAKMTLLPGWQTERGTRMAGIRITLEPGWKTYWRAPQGSGIPPQFDWSGSQNLAGLTVHFPAPEIFESYGMRSLGYHDQVVFPVEIAAKDPAQPISLVLGMGYGVCEDVCIPAVSSDRLTIPAGASGNEAEIRAAWQSRPVSAKAAGFSGAGCSIRPEGDGYAMTALLDYPGTPAKPEMVVFETGAEDVWITPERISTGSGGLRIDASVEYFGDGAFALDRSALRLTMFGEGQPVELLGCPAL